MLNSLRFLISITAALLLLSSGCTKEVQPPNVVLIITDDQGFGDFGFTGNELIETPVLDDLKTEAAYFDRFFVSPVCAPTRASLLSGRYHLRTGTSWVTHGKETMRPEEKTLAEALKEHGYATACFGKWHNGAHYPQNPQGQGFDTFFGFSAGHWNNYFDTKLEYNGKMVATEGYIADVLTDSALSFIQENREKPFFCYVPYNTPHGPFQVADAYFDKYKNMGLDDKNAAVYGMCENIDDNIGRILEKLDDLELADNTIVVFLTDNGPNGNRYNGGMKGRKGHVDEGGVRVPLLIRYPGVVNGGQTIHGLSSHIDLLPTIHGLCGLSFEEDKPIDGIDLSTYINTGDTIQDRLIFSHQVWSGLQSYPASVRSPEYRLVVLPDREPFLYNMLTDPGQKENIASIMPEVTAFLKDTLDNWYNEVSRNQPYNPGIPIGYAEAPLAQLPAHEARLSGSLEFIGENGWANDWITKFQAGNNTASWDLEVVEEGSHEVILELSSGAMENQEHIIVEVNDQGLSFSTKEEIIAALVPSPDRIPRGEVYERDWFKVNMGEVELEKGPVRIEITFKGDLSCNLEIKSVILKQK